MKEIMKSIIEYTTFTYMMVTMGLGGFLLFAFIHENIKKKKHKHWYCRKCDAQLQQVKLSNSMLYTELAQAKQEIERLRMQLNK